MRAYVKRQRQALDSGLVRERNEPQGHRRREVVKAVEPEVFKGLHRLAFAGTGEPCYDHEAGESRHEPPESVLMKLFSPEKVNALIPVVTPLVEELWGKRRELAIRLLENDPALRTAGNRAKALAADRRTEARRCTELKAEIVGIIDRIEGYGCVVKDLDLGLLDFPALREGRPVFLCWKAGEPSIAHWHGVDESFVDRRVL